MASYELNTVDDAGADVATAVTDYGNDDGITNAHLTRRHRGDSEKLEAHRSQDEAAIAKFGKKQQLKVRRLSKATTVLCNPKLTFTVATLQVLILRWADLWVDVDVGGHPFVSTFLSLN